MARVKVRSRVKTRVSIRARIEVRVRVGVSVSVSYIMTIWRWEEFSRCDKFPTTPASPLGRKQAQASDYRYCKCRNTIHTIIYTFAPIAISSVGCWHCKTKYTITKFEKK